MVDPDISQCLVGNHNGNTVSAGERMLKLLSAKVFEIGPKFAKAIAKTIMLAVFFMFPPRATQPQNRSWDARSLTRSTLTIMSLGYPCFLCKCSTVLQERIPFISHFS